MIGKGWVAAGDLVVGDEVYNLDGTTSTVLVYNLEVEDFHSYFVGFVPVLVHNYKKSSDIDGGAYGNVASNGGQVHHTPAKSVSPFSEKASPALRMSPEDHMKTASWGNSYKAQQYREEQAYLISQGLYKEAQQMDFDDIHLKFGNKYDTGIQQAKEQTNKLFGYSMWP